MSWQRRNEDLEGKENESKEKVMKVYQSIQTVNKAICDNIENGTIVDRGLLSQNILAQLRNLVEHTAIVTYGAGNDIEVNYDNIEKGLKYIKANKKPNFLSKFHKLLQVSSSHYTIDGDGSERLMLKYYEYLIRIKKYLRDEFSISILSNLSKFPVEQDKTTQDYYKKISERLNDFKLGNPKKDRYYIQKIKPFFVKEDVYYEVTFTRAHDKVSKFDRIIAFTTFDIPQNYAVELTITQDNINILEKDTLINIITDWQVSIRPCELDNFCDIFGAHSKITTSHKEYKELMKFLTKTGYVLNDLLEIEEEQYQTIKTRLTEGGKIIFFDAFDQCRVLVQSNSPASNIIRYLLYILNNKIIKKQILRGESNPMLSHLHLEWGCLPFDQMPYNTSPINHNPRIYDLFECISPKNREHEFFARFIRNNTEIHGHIFSKKDEIEKFENIDTLISEYNRRIYKKHTQRFLDTYKKFVYIREYKDDTLAITEEIMSLSSSGIKNYSNSVNAWLHSSGYHIDCADKKKALIEIFENSRIALIYGSAGTGKSTLINHISHFFHDKRKLYLTNTNPAIDNLKRKVDASNCNFMTIAKFLSRGNSNTAYNIVFIDESSTVSNHDMVKVLEKVESQLLVLVGDIFQIESIQFGNWFDVVKSFVPETSVFELEKPYRTKNEKLLLLWEKVRSMSDDIAEHIARHGYSTKLDESIFENYRNDEIILCLNYDGLYGINNINRFLQNNNNTEPINWGDLIYKVNDPILFNDTQRFGSLIYNNLKGKILKIETTDRYIQFNIEIDKVLNETDVMFYELELLDSDDMEKSVIQFKVNKYRSSDEDEDSSDAIIPFQVAYAVSIHKAQGLEYDSVKIVISNEVEERITHNIFYTAITRAKEKLKIYWSPEIQNKVLENMQIRDNKRDTNLLKNLMSKS
ncbi:MAG: AAA family ATPase [Sulfurovum sp.]|nr:AAA family ATPase [Sulfurovum sp.]